MSHTIQWPFPSNNQFGNGMVYRQFAVCSTIYAVGFEAISSAADLTQKNINISQVHPLFQFPAAGVWGIVFDEISPYNTDFKGFQHIQHNGLAGGRVLYYVASIIIEHYNTCKAGAYIFSAAEDKQCLRQTDLTRIYDGLLGLGGKQKSKLFANLFAGWKAYSDTQIGGRSYVITTENY